MKLSVIIPCRDCAETIGRQLDALARQAWSDGWEVVIADNGSTDASVRVIETYRDRLPGLQVVDASDRKGPGHARNVGARHANGDAFLFCDADDEVGEGWLNAMGRALEQHGLVASAHDLEKLNDELILATRKNNQKDSVQSYSYPPYLPHAAGCGLGVKREVHELVGGFDEAMLNLQDTDYCWRIQLTGTPLEFVPEAVVHYQLRSDLRQTFRQALRYGEYNVLLYKRYRRHGMPRISLKDQIRGWVRLVKGIAGIADEERRARLIRDLGWRLGRLKGSLKYRVMAL
jgi:glycosyltransferase involved in cell wall biosynthesis